MNEQKFKMKKMFKNRRTSKKKMKKWKFSKFQKNPKLKNIENPVEKTFHLKNLNIIHSSAPLSMALITYLKLIIFYDNLFIVISAPFQLFLMYIMRKNLGKQR